LDLSVTNPPSNVRAYITVYNRHADYISVYGYAVNDGDDVYLTYDVTEPGTYYVRLHERDNDTATDDYAFTANFTPVIDNNEPNSRLGNATLINESLMTGTLFDRNDQDWFKVWAEPGTLTFIVTPPDEMRPQITVYNPDMGYIQSGASVNPGEPKTVECSVSRTGFYYLRITDANSGSHLASYTLATTGGTLTDAPSTPSVTVEAEENNSLGQANPISVGASITGAISQAGDRDWYRFNVASCGQLTIAMDTVPPGLHQRFRLYNSSAEHAMTAQATNIGETFSLIYEVESPGIFFLVVDDIDSSRFSNASYTFTTTLVPVDDPLESNDDFGDAKKVTDFNRLTPYIFPKGDHDWFRVTVSDNQPLQIVVSNLPENIVPAISIYNTSKESLVGKTGAAGMDMALAYTVPGPGDYFVRMRAADGNSSSTSPYTLTIHGAAFGSYAPTAQIDQIDPGAIVVGDAISFTGSGIDSDGTITGYSWRSNIDGELGSASSFSTSDLSVGTHTIYFKVQDDNDIWSTEVTQVVYVGSSISEEVEPNDRIGHANEIALDRPVPAKINKTGDNDYFKVYLAQPGRLTWSTTNVPENLRLYLTCYGRHLDYISTYAYATQDGDSVALSMDITEPGFYYLRIHDRDNDANDGFTYTLRPSFVAVVDGQEPNNSLLDSRPMTEETAQGYLFPGNDEDWYRVWVDGGQTVQIAVSDTPANLRPYITVYGIDREYLSLYSYAENPGDNPPALSRSFDASGFIYIRVHDRDRNFNETETYTLAVSGANPGFSPLETPLAGEVEPNDGIAAANLIVPETAVQGGMDTETDKDWFKFRIPSAGIIHTHVDHIPASMRGRVRLYRDDASYINGRDATNPGDALALDTRVTLPGIYYIQLDDLALSNPDDPYRLTVSVTPVADVYEPNNKVGDATVLEDGNRIQAMIFEQGDEDWYRVKGTAGQSLDVTIADVPAEIQPVIDIYDSSQSRLTGRTATNPGQAITVSCEMAETGYYYIRIRHAGHGNCSDLPYTLIVNGAAFNSYAPVAVIHSMTPNPAETGETVTLDGGGQDNDGEIIGYSWRSSIDGEFSVSRIASISDLSQGVHTVSFMVMDDDDNWSPETTALLYYGVPAPGEQEPNDVIGQSTLMKKETFYAGRMDRAGDYDYYRIKVDQPGRLTIEAVNPSGSSPMRIYLSGYTLDAEWASRYAYANADQDPVTLVWDIAEAGDYFIRVHDNGGRPDGQYTLKASLQATLDPYEPNSDVANAASLSPGGVVQASIFPASDNDYYKLTVSSQGRLGISLTDTSTLRGYITLYDANNNYMSVYTYANNDGDNVNLDYNVVKPGTYYIRIYDRDSDSSLAPYTLSTTFTPVIDSNENNNEFKRATAVTGSPVEGYIFSSGDEDWYRIMAQAGTSLSMTVADPPENLRPQMTLYGANNNYIGSVYTDTEGETVTYTVNAPVSEYYYLKVTDRDNDWSASPYRLSITGASFAPIPDGSPVTTASGNNTAFKSADLIGTAGVTGTLANKDTRHWYRFDVGQASMLNLQLTVPGDLRPVLELYDANNNRVVTRTAQNAGDAAWIQYAVNAPGIWYVLVHGADSGSANPYQLELTMEPAVDAHEPNDSFDSSRSIIFGEPVQAAIFPAGDADWFSMDVAAPGMIKFMLNEVPDNIQICFAVYDLNNSQLLSMASLNPGQPLEGQFFAPEAGTYFVRIYDRDNNSGAVSRYTLTAYLTPFEDVFEPNNRYSQATLLSEENRVSALVYPATDQDWYVFTVSRPGTLRVQVTDTDGIQPHLQLFSSSKSSLVTKAAKNRSDDLLLTYAVTEADRYYLVIRDNGDNDYSHRPYVLTILGADFDACAPMASIEAIQPNPSITGTPVTLAGSGYFEEGEASAFEWHSDLDGALGDATSLTRSTLSAGTHVISFRIRDMNDNWSAWVRKRLHVTDTIFTESEYNNAMDTANPAPLATWITGRIYPSGDEDYYKIHLDHPGYLSVLMDGVPPEMRGYVTFYDGEKQYISRYDYAANDGEWVRYGFYADAGWYYVRIHDRDSRSHEGTYGVYFELSETFDPDEPNNSLGSATPVEIGVPAADAYISPANDDDWYRVEVPSSGRLSMSLTGAPATMRGYMTLYNADGDYLSVYNYAYYGGEDVFLDYDVLTPGTYYIRVHDRDSLAHTEPYVFKADFTAVVDNNEPNGTMEEAMLMGETPAIGHIFPRNDNDWYKIYADPGTTLNLAVTGTPETMRARLTIYDSNFSYQVAQTVNNSGDNLYYNYGVPAGGVYYIQVSDSNGISHTGAYTFTVENGTPGYEPKFAPVTVEAEDNSDAGLATDIPINTDIAGRVDPYNDYDWFRFRIHSAGIISVSHTEIPPEIKSEFWVYDGNKTQIGYRLATNTGEDETLTLAVESGGYYYVRLRDHTSTGSSSPYTLRVDYDPVVDSNEPNNGSGTATALGQDTVDGYIIPNGDQDWYRVYVRTPGTLSLSLDKVPADLKPLLYLYNPDMGQEGFWSGTSAGQGGEDLIRFDVPEPGFYYVMVKNGIAADYSDSPYTLRITGADFSMAPVLHPIGNRTIDETMSYGFTVNADDPDNPMDLVFSATNLPPGASFDPATRTFHWTPDRGEVGTYDGIHFKVSDGTYTDSEDISITVAGLSRAPVLTPIGNRSVKVGENLTFQLSATDPDEDDLTYSVVLPYGTSGAALEGDTFSWTPSDGQVKTHTGILFRVTDGTWTDFEYIDIQVTATVPKVTTGEITDITETGATVSGEVTIAGGSAVTEKGVVYATHDAPTLDDAKVAYYYSGTGAYTVALSGLTKGSPYYARAYAVNSLGTAYGATKGFSTKSVAEPLIHVTPTTADFGTVRRDDHSAAMSFTVKNDGDADLVIGDIGLTGNDPAAFQIQNDLCSGQTLEPSITATLEVVFSPTAIGQKTADLSIGSNDADTPTLTVALVGEGLPIKGDIDNSGNVDMKDLILALQVVNGVQMSPDTIYRGADVNGDKMIGMQDVMYILWRISLTAD